MSEEAQGQLVIHTTESDWLPAVAKAYRARTAFVLVDDAAIGINPLNDTLVDMGRKAGLGQREWMALLVSLGIGSAGAFLLVMAILDPEPFSKITFALGTGAMLMLGGGLTAIRVLLGHKPPNVKVSPGGGFEIWFG